MTGRREARCGLCGAPAAPRGAAAGALFLECAECGFVWTEDVDAGEVAARYSGRPAAATASSSPALLAVRLARAEPSSLLALDLGCRNPGVPNWLRRRGRRCLALDLEPERHASAASSLLERLVRSLQPHALLLLHSDSDAATRRRCPWWYVTPPAAARRWRSAA